MMEDSFWLLQLPISFIHNCERTKLIKVHIKADSLECCLIIFFQTQEAYAIWVWHLIYWNRRQICYKQARSNHFSISLSRIALEKGRVQTAKLFLIENIQLSTIKNFCEYLVQTKSHTLKTLKAIDNASVTVGRVGAALAASPDDGRVEVAVELPSWLTPWLPWLPWLSFTQADVEGGEPVVLPWLTPSTWDNQDQ